MSTVIAAGLSHVGLVREHNEDSYFCGVEEGVFIVADGMGGHAAGEVASGMAVDGARANWTHLGIKRLVEDYVEHGDVERRTKLIRRLQEGVMGAHKEILDSSKADSSKEGMGTTFTGMLLAGGEAIFAHAGDSRAYLIRDRIPVQLSEDHTISSRLRAAGIAKGIDGPAPERWKGILTNALGMEDATRISMFVLPIYSADRIVLCTDGVHDYLSEVEVGELVSGAASPALAAQKLVDTALERGGGDNATCIVLRVVEADESRTSPEIRRKDKESIAACPLFDGLSPQQVLRALRITTPRNYEDGRDIPKVALEDRVAYLVLDGELEGPHQSYRAGELVRASSLLREVHREEPPMRAKGDVRLLMIRHNDFAELCEDDPDLGVVLYETLGRIVAAS